MAIPKHLGYHLITFPFLLLILCLMLDYYSPTHASISRVSDETMNVYSSLENALRFARERKQRSLKI